MKLKIKTVLSVLILMAILSSSFSSTATTLIPEPDYPATVELGDTITIVANFVYPDETDCLYGDELRLYYGVGTTFYLNPYANRIDVDITKISGYPRPTEVPIELDTSLISCQVNDTIRFAINVQYGESFDDFNTINPIRSINIGFYDITIVEASSVPDLSHLPTLSVILPLLLLSVVVLVRKKKLKKEVK